MDPGNRDHISLPQDWGLHRRAASEWWYFAGRLTDTLGAEHAYMLCFFRSHILVDLTRFAHFLLASLSDDPRTAAVKHVSPLGRKSSIHEGRLDINYDGWTATFDGRLLHITAQHGDSGIDLTLSCGDLMLSGRDGAIVLPGTRTLCYSFPRLATTGKIRRNGTLHDVSGVSWFDHEWGRISLPQCWNWWGINLEDGTDLIVRYARGEGVANVRYPGGETETTTAVLPSAVGHWQSSDGATYPVEWNIRLPDLQVELDVRPERPDCEAPFAVRYWEGPCSVRARVRGQPVEGRGYMELVGYNTRPVRFILSRTRRILQNLFLWLPARRARRRAGSLPLEPRRRVE